jgi:hypothetical protein
MPRPLYPRGEGLDIAEKRKFLILPGLELQPLSLPARSQSLYRLRSNRKDFTFFTLTIYVDSTTKYIIQKLSSKNSFDNINI